MFSDTENCLNTYTFAYMYIVHVLCTQTQFKHTHINTLKLWILHLGGQMFCAVVVLNSTFVFLYNCMVMKAMTNKKKQFYMYGWNKWYKLFVKCCNFLLLQSETAVLNIRWFTSMKIDRENKRFEMISVTKKIHEKPYRKQFFSMIVHCPRHLLLS